MTVIRPNSIAGITSIAALGDNISFYNSDGVNISQFNANINSITGVSTIANLSVTGVSTISNLNATGVSTIANLRVTGVVTASSYYGDGSNLTGISSVSFATTSFGLSGNPSVLVSGIGINTTSASQQFQVGSGTSIVVIDSSGDLGIGTVSVPSRFYVQGNAAGNIVSIGNTNATTTLDFTRGNNFTLTLTGNITIANPTGVTTGQSGVILIQEDGTGGYTCAWGTSWDFASSTAPTLTTTANALNALPYFARSTTSIVVGSVIAGIGTL